MPDSSNAFGVQLALSTDLVNVATHVYTPLQTLDAQFYKGTDLVCAATITLPATTAGATFTVTGATGPVTAISSRTQGHRITLIFSGAPTITHNGTSLILPGARDITVVAGMVLTFVSLGSGNWQLISNSHANFFTNLTITGQLDSEGYASIGNGLALSADVTTAIGRSFTATGVGHQLSVSGGTLTAAANQNTWIVQIRGSGGITTPASSTNQYVGTMNIEEPNITKGDTIDNAFTLRIAGAPTEGSANYSLWVDGGRVRIDEGAIIGDTTSTNQLLDDASNGAGTTALYIGNAAVTVASDIRLKKDIETTKLASDALKLINRMRVVDFTWDDPSDTAPVNRNSRGRYVGMIAQETVDIAPWIINAPDRKCPQCRAGEPCQVHTSRWYVEYTHLVPLLVKAIQELAAKGGVNGPNPTGVTDGTVPVQPANRRAASGNRSAKKRTGRGHEA